MQANGVSLLYIGRNDNYDDYWKYWTGLTGGGCYQLSDSSSNDITNAITFLISATVSNIRSLTLKPDRDMNLGYHISR